MRLGQTERDAVEEADAVAGGVAALPGQPALVVQEDEVVLDFPGRDPIRAAAVVTGEAGDGAEVGLPDVLGEAANGHVVDHALTKWRHGASPSGSDRSRKTRPCSCSWAVGDYRSTRENGDQTACRDIGRTVPSFNLPAVGRSLRIRGGQATPPRNAAQFNGNYAEFGIAGTAASTPHSLRPCHRSPLVRDIPPCSAPRPARRCQGDPGAALSPRQGRQQPRRAQRRRTRTCFLPQAPKSEPKLGRYLPPLYPPLSPLSCLEVDQGPGGRCEGCLGSEPERTACPQE